MAGNLWRLAGNRSKKKGSLVIRRAVADDARLVKQLEVECGLSAWTEDDYRAGAKGEGAHLVVSEVDREIIGFLYARLITNENPAAVTGVTKPDTVKTESGATEIELCNLAVHREYRRSGVAHKLLCVALDGFAENDSFSIFLEVRESNAPAVRFYYSNGFEMVGKRPSYYRNPVEDALIMRLSR